MIREFFTNLITRAKKAAHAIKGKVMALAHRLLPPVTVKRSLLPAISIKTVHALHMSRRYRLTSDHSPIFSLYTFFADSQ